MQRAILERFDLARAPTHPRMLRILDLSPEWERGKAKLVGENEVIARRPPAAVTMF